MHNTFYQSFYTQIIHFLSKYYRYIICTIKILIGPSVCSAKICRRTGKSRRTSLYSGSVLEEQHGSTGGDNGKPCTIRPLSR